MSNSKGICKHRGVVTPVWYLKNSRYRECDLEYFIWPNGSRKHETSSPIFSLEQGAERIRRPDHSHSRTSSELTAPIGAFSPRARGSLLTVIGVAEALDAQGAGNPKKRESIGIISTGTGKRGNGVCLGHLLDDFENGQSSKSVGWSGHIKISTGNG